MQIWHEELLSFDEPLVAIAVHDGGAVRPELQERFELSRDGRLREEDPFTGLWTHVADLRVWGTHSRFQVDLNRPLERAVYQQPEDAWGLRVWSEPLDEALVAKARAEHESFYARLHEVLSKMESLHGRFVVYDLHTYNHRRLGPDAAPAPVESNPEVNLGTGTMDRERWAPVVDAFMSSLREGSSPSLDVRENVKFQGGELSRWVHEQFPESGCSLAIEFKKTFMDEWTGVLDEGAHRFRTAALQATVGPVLNALKGLELLETRQGA